MSAAVKGYAPRRSPLCSHNRNGHPSRSVPAAPIATLRMNPSCAGARDSAASDVKREAMAIGEMTACRPSQASAETARKRNGRWTVRHAIAPATTAVISGEQMSKVRRGSGMNSA